MYNHIITTTVSHQWRTLLEAIQSDDIQTVNLILKTDGWPTDTSFSDYETLITAIKFGRRDITHLLLDKNCRVYYGTGINTPLHYAVQHHWADVVKRLLEKGCRVSLANSSNKTALHVAHTDKATGSEIDFLLQHYLRESNANIVSKNGLSTLHIACSRPDAQIVEQLLEADDSLIDQPIVGSLSTPLHYAVNNRQHKVARLLLDHGADIYKRDSEGSTPLHWALWTRDVHMIDMILRYDLRRGNTVNRFGISHFMAACAGSHLDTVIEFVESLSATKSIYPQDLMATQVKKLGSYSGFTPLHFAADFGSNADIVRLLLRLGSKCCATTCHNLTPHIIANMKGHTEISHELEKNCPNKPQELNRTL